MRGPVEGQKGGQTFERDAQNFHDAVQESMDDFELCRFGAVDGCQAALVSAAGGRRLIHQHDVTDFKQLQRQRRVLVVAQRLQQRCTRETQDQCSTLVNSPMVVKNVNLSNGWRLQSRQITALSDLMDFFCAVFQKHAYRAEIFAWPLSRPCISCL